MMTKQRVLIVEDEIKLANLLKDYLLQAGYEVDIIGNGLDVEPWIEDNQPDAILLDIMLPGKDGIEICKAVRLRSDVPILMITAKVEEIDRLIGLELGADDYICKPFSPREVVARVKTVLRRLNPPRLAIAPASSELTLDEEQYLLTYQNNITALTAIEMQLFKPLYAAPGRIFSREQLMQHMYVDNRIVNDRTIDSHIKKLRKKMSEISPDKKLIQSVYGVGYKLVLEDG